LLFWRFDRKFPQICPGESGKQKKAAPVAGLGGLSSHAAGLRPSAA